MQRLCDKDMSRDKDLADTVSGAGGPETMDGQREGRGQSPLLKKTMNVVDNAARNNHFRG